MTKIDSHNRLVTVKIKKIDIVALAVDALQTVWTPNEGEKLFLMSAIIQCRSQLTAVTTLPRLALLSNGVFVSEIFTPPIIVGDAIGIRMQLQNATSAAVAVSFTIATDLVTWGSGTPVAHNLKLGDPVIFPTVVTTTGIVAGTTYYAIPTVTNGTTLKVASSYANALAGTAIDLATGDGTGTATAGSAASQITNDHPLKLKVVTDQVGGTVLTYDLILVGIKLNDLVLPSANW